MAKWCLIPKEADLFIKKLRDGSINPEKLAEMAPDKRHDFFETFLSKENATQVNGLFESKLLLKNQKIGYITWAKKVAGLNPTIKKDLISRIEKLERVLTPEEGEAFKRDLAITKLNTAVTEEQARKLGTLSKEISETRVKAKLDEVEKLTPTQSVEWLKNKENNANRLEYGRKVIALDNYFAELKQEASRLSIKEQLKDPLTTGKKIVGTTLDTSKAMNASMDNSALFNQGFGILTNYKSIGIWRRNALKSFENLVRTFRGKPVWDEFRADLVSRPNYINGLYKEHKIALNVIEEAYPTSLPEKLPFKVGKAYKATETTFNIFQFKNRADVADLFLALAEKNGQILRGQNKMEGLGNLINSLTGRGSLGKLEPVGNVVNAPFFSLRRQVALIDALTGYQLGKKSAFVRKQGAIASAQQIATIAIILGVAKALHPDGIEEDPTSTDFGKIKVGDTRIDVTGGRAAYVTLAMRLLKGETKSSTSDKVTKLNSGKFGSPTYFSVLEDFSLNKVSPALGQAIQVMKGEDRQGNKPTALGVLKGLYTPIGIQNMESVLKNPNAANFLLSTILDGVGILTNTYPQSNIKTQMIPEGAQVTNDSFIDAVQLYAKALGTDPETAFNRIFTGQKITKVTNGTVMVERLPLKDSQNIKKKAGANNPAMKLDHTIPLQLGGSNNNDNLKLVPTGVHNTYTSVENALGKALKANKINKKQAQEWIIAFKQGKLTKEAVLGKIPK